MGRTTFEPAVSAPFWPWGDLGVYVLGSRVPPGTPARVAVDDDPAWLLERLQTENRRGDVHLVGGPTWPHGVIEVAYSVTPPA